MEHLRARPTPHEMGLRLVCVKKLVTTRPSQRDKPWKLQMGKGGGEIFKKAELKRFLWYGLWDFSIIFTEKPFLLQFKLQDSFFFQLLTEYLQQWFTETESRITLQWYKYKRQILVCHQGEKEEFRSDLTKLSLLECSQHRNHCCVIIEGWNDKKVLAAQTLPSRISRSNSFWK